MISLYLPSESKMGAGYQAHAMANAFVERGWEVTMHSPCAKPEDALYEHVTVPVGTSLRTFRFAWELRRYDWSRFDVVHAHGDDYFLWLKKPVHVRTMHGSCLAEALHIPGLKEKLRMVMLGLAEVVAACVAHRTVGVSENTRASYPWIRQVIPNGVNLDKYHPRNPGSPPASLGVTKAPAPTILFVGTYKNRKRGDLLMRAFEQRVRVALPDAQLWMVCGDAPPAPGVTVFGRVSEEKLTELYRQAWVFCLPSSYEGFGVPYIEAMASGTAVVATPNPGANEVLAQGRFGRLVEPEALGDALVELLQNRDERERLEVARTRARAGFRLAASDRAIRGALPLARRGLGSRHFSRRIAEARAPPAGFPSPPNPHSAPGTLNGACSLIGDMNIALFPSAFHPHFGGVEELVRQLAHELQRRGHGVIVLTNRWPRNLPAFEEFEGLPVYRLPFRTSEQSWKSKLTYRLTHERICGETLRILDRHAIDVLHVQCVSSNAHYALRARALQPRPLVVTLQGELTMDAERIFERFETARTTLRRALREADIVTGCSTKTIRDAEHFLGESMPAARTIFNAANLDDFAQAQPWTHARPYIFALGRLVPQKGFDLLINSFADAALPAHDLLIAGEGAERGPLEAAHPKPRARRARPSARPGRAAQSRVALSRLLLLRAALARR